MAKIKVEKVGGGKHFEAVPDDEDTGRMKRVEVKNGETIQIEESRFELLKDKFRKVGSKKDDEEAAPVGAGVPAGSFPPAGAGDGKKAAEAPSEGRSGPGRK